jgi:hypothetical protein
VRFLTRYHLSVGEVEQSIAIFRGCEEESPKDLKFEIMQGVSIEILRAQKARPQDDNTFLRS